MKVNPKSEKGAITIIVLVAMLFLTALLISIYLKTANKARNISRNNKTNSRRI